MTVNSPACQAALQWYYDGWHRQPQPADHPRPQGEGTYVPLGTGQAAMMISAQGGFRADINRALNGAYRLEFRVMPKGPGNRVGGFLALNSNAILRASTQPDAGWEVLKWLSNKDSSYALATQQTGSNTPNFRKDTYCDPRLLADPRFAPRSMEAICKGAELPEPDALIWNLRYDDFNRLLVSRMADIRDGKAEPTAGWLNALRVPTCRPSPTSPAAPASGAAEARPRRGERRRGAQKGLGPKRTPSLRQVWGARRWRGTPPRPPRRGPPAARSPRGAPARSAAGPPPGAPPAGGPSRSPARQADRAAGDQVDGVPVELVPQAQRLRPAGVGGDDAHRALEAGGADGLVQGRRGCR